MGSPQTQTNENVPGVSNKPDIPNKPTTHTIPNKPEDTKIDSPVIARKAHVAGVEFSECTITDTGAGGAGAITLKAVAELRRAGALYQYLPARSQVRGLGNSLVTAYGEIRASLRLAGSTIHNARFKIVEEIISDIHLLVSTQQLKALQASVDLVHDVIRTPKGKVHFTTSRPSKEHRWTLAATAQCTVQPGSVAELPCRAVGRDWWISKKPDTLMVASATEPLLPEYLSAFPGLYHYSKKCGFVVRMCNTGFGPVTVEKGAVIGYGSEFDSSWEIVCSSAEAGVDIVAASAEDVDDRALPPALEKKDRQTIIKEIRAAIDSNPHLNKDRKKKLTDLLLQFPKLFHKELKDPGAAEAPPFRIKVTKDAQPTRCRPHRHSAQQADLVDKHVELMQAARVVEPAPPGCAWAAPVVLIRKRDSEEWRFCVDFKALNAITIKNSFPIPRIDEILQRLKGAEWFSTLDMISGYWQLLVHPDDKDKTAFVTRRGLYVFRVLPFGLSNAPSHFQQAMNTILGSDIGKCCFVYLDDVIIFSRSFEAHLQHLKRVLSKLNKANMYVKLSKCKFAQPEVLYLGHIVNCDGIKTNPALVDKVWNTPRPRNRNEVHHFIGLANYYRSFIERFAERTEPLQRLLRNEVPWEWKREQQAAFADIKTAMTTAPLLRHPDPSRPFTVRLDGSGVAIGAVLEQLDDKGFAHPVAYGSHLLSEQQRRWFICERECYAIYYFLRHWRHFLLGQHFYVFSDQKTLKDIANVKDPHSKLANWYRELQEFDFTIVYVKGEENVADPLSRPPFAAANDADKKERDPFESGTKLAQFLSSRISPVLALREQRVQEVEALTVTLAGEDCDQPGAAVPTWIQAQREDTLLGAIAKTIASDGRTLPSDAAEAAIIKSLAGQCMISKRDGCVYYADKNDRKAELWRLAVPTKLIKPLLEEFHEGPSGGHRSAEQMKWRIQQAYWWPKMDSIIRNYAKSCQQCQERSEPRGPTAGRLAPIRWATRPALRWAIDLVDMPVSVRGCKKMIVCVDTFSRYIFTAALPDAKAETVANFVYEKIVLGPGPAEAFHSDQGPEFMGLLRNRMRTALGFKYTTSTAHHPQSNGICERVHRTLLDSLSKMCSLDQKDWDVVLSEATWAYNCTPHSSTGFSPYFLMHGRDPMTGLDIVLSRTPTTPQSKKECASEVIRRLEKAFPEALKQIREAQERMKKYYDQDRKDTSFEEGHLVLLKRPSVDQLQGQRRKLYRPWKGPYRVRRIIGAARLVAEVQHMSNPNDIQRVSVHRLKHYYQVAHAENEQESAEDAEVESIEAERPIKDRPSEKEYLIKWKGFTRKYRSWVHEKDINAEELLTQWRQRQARSAPQTTAPTAPPAPATAPAASAPPVPTKKHGRKKKRPQQAEEVAPRFEIQVHSPPSAAATPPPAPAQQQQAPQASQGNQVPSPAPSPPQPSSRPPSPPPAPAATPLPQSATPPQGRQASPPPPQRADQPAAGAAPPQQGQGQDRPRRIHQLPVRLKDGTYQLPAWLPAGSVLVFLPDGG